MGLIAKLTSGARRALGHSGTRALGGEAPDETDLEEYLADPQVLIEITSRCNFTCDYCSSAFKARAKQDMSIELFEHIVRQLPGLTTKAVRLHIDGEPTLHPRFRRMVEILNEHGLQAGIATNGSLLDPEWLDLDMQLVITVSTHPDELARRHKRLDWEQYQRTVREYVRAWTESESRQKLMVQLITGHGGPDGRIGREHWRAFVDRFVEETGLNERCKPDEARPNVHRKPNGAVAVLIEYPIVAGGLYPEDGEFVAADPVDVGFCDSPWKRLAVMADGRVSYCCIDLSGGTAYSQPDDVRNDSLVDLWRNHPRVREVRAAFRRGEVIESICKTCLGSAKGGKRSVGFN